MVRRPSVTSSTLLNLNISEARWPVLIKFYLKHHWGQGDCLRFGGRLDENSGFHGNRYFPLTYKGENGVRSKTISFLIGASSNLQVTGHL